MISTIEQASRMQNHLLGPDRRIGKNGAPETWTLTSDPALVVDRQSHLDYLADVCKAERFHCGDPRWAALRDYVALLRAELEKRAVSDAN